MHFSASDLVENSASSALSHVTRAQETDLPASAKITYISTASAYPQAIAEARRIAGASHRVATATLPLVLDASQADAIADSWLFESWAAREKAAFTLPPSRLALEPGDTIALSTGERSYRLRITEIGEHGARDIQALSIDPDIYAPVPVTPRADTVAQQPAAGRPLAMLLDIPSPTDNASDSTGYIAAMQFPWPGTIAVWRSPEQSGFALNTLLPTPATTGVTVNALNSGPPWRLDRANRLTVDIDGGSLSSITRLQLLGGANLAAIERVPDVWELLQFESATLVGPQRYELATLLRGQRGSDTPEGVIIPAGSRFVLLDGSVQPVSMTPDDIAIAYNWKIGPASRDIGDAAYVGLAHTFRGVGLQPLRPVQVRGRRNDAGDLAVTWLRRTRKSGDNWEPADVPLGEDDESYRVEFLAGAQASAAVVRTVTTSITSLVYTAAQQTADLGAPGARVTLRVAQVSRAVGQGATTTVTL